MLQTISDILGWGYFLAWGCSLYPIIYNNYKRKSVAGFSFEYQLWNWSGFLWYLVFTCFGTHFQKEYGLPPSIHANDIAFALNALINSTITGIQCFLYYKPQPDQKYLINPVHFTLALLIWVIGLYNILLGLGNFLPWYSTEASAYAFSVIQYFGFAKSFVSLIKYTPQAYLNFKVKNTLGWAIQNTLMDAVGGILSLAQMIVDAYAHPTADGNPNWEKITGNVPKVLLAVESLAFDVLFIIQHFVLYKKNNAILLEQERMRLQDEQSLLSNDMTSELLINDVSSSSYMPVLDDRDYSI